MPRFRFFTRERPASRFRARLRLESLEWRDQPSLLGEFGGVEPLEFGADQVPANVAPVISDFTAEEVGNGLFLFTGRVTDEAPGGLVVTFGGGVPSVSGLTATADENGHFSLLVRLKTDGTEGGTVSATTTDAQGATSNEAYVYASPTPAP